MIYPARGSWWVPPAATGREVHPEAPVTAAIVASGLSKRFGRTDVVRSLDLRIEPGELYGLVGPNGAGKTTTIRMLLGLVRPTEGEVHIHGRLVGPQSLRHVGAIVEEPGFWGYLSARKNLSYLARSGGRGPDSIAARSVRHGSSRPPTSDWDVPTIASR